MDTPERLDPVEQDYLNDLLRQQRDAQVALDTYAGFLYRKHGLRPGMDSINPDGIIVRQPDGEPESTV